MTMRSKQWYTKTSRLSNSFANNSIGRLLNFASQTKSSVRRLVESIGASAGSARREERVSKGKETGGFVPFGLPPQPCQTPRRPEKPSAWKFQICLARTQATVSELAYR